MNGLNFHLAPEETAEIKMSFWELIRLWPYAQCGSIETFISSEMEEMTTFEMFDMALRI